MEPHSDTLRTRWTLVARLKNAEDHASWAEFDAIYRPLILGIASKSGLRTEEAQDVAQETMRAFAAHLQSGKFVASAGNGSLRAWLFQMARWRIRDQFRKRLPAGSSGESSVEPSTSGTARTPTVERLADPREPDLELLCDEGWKLRVQELALQELQLEVKADHYQVFHLLALEGKPIEEVARMVGKNRAQIYLIKHRVAGALRKIVRRMERRWG